MAKDRKLALRRVRSLLFRSSADRAPRDRGYWQGEVAELRFCLSSPTPEIDEAIIRTIRAYQAQRNTGVQASLLEREIARIAKSTKPEWVDDVIVQNFHVSYGGSVVVTFALVWTSLVSLYTLLSHYDDFKRSLARLREDVSALLASVLAGKGEIFEDADLEIQWSEGVLLAELNELQRAISLHLDEAKEPGSQPARPGGSALVWYLGVTNVLLAVALVALVLRAVRAMYFG